MNLVSRIPQATQHGRNKRLPPTAHRPGESLGRSMDTHISTMVPTIAGPFQTSVPPRDFGSFFPKQQGARHERNGRRSSCGICKHNQSNRPLDILEFFPKVMLSSRDLRSYLRTRSAMSRPSGMVETPVQSPLGRIIRLTTQSLVSNGGVFALGLSCRADFGVGLPQLNVLGLDHSRRH